jgi:hypothetical protein
MNMNPQHPLTNATAKEVEGQANAGEDFQVRILKTTSSSNLHGSKF